MANIIQINGYTISSSNGGGGPSTPTFPYTGSAIISGSLTVTGSATSTLGFTGSLLGTSSWATNALTASRASTASYFAGSNASISDDGSGNITFNTARTIISASNKIILQGNNGVDITGTTTINGDLLPGGPYTNNTSSYSLGSTSAAWKDLYVSNGSVYFISGSNTASISFTNGAIDFNNTSVNIPAGSTVPTASFASTASFLQGSVTSASFASTSSFYNGQSTVGANLITQASPSAIRYLRINADNSISQLTLAQLKTDLGVSSAILSTTISQSSNTAADITGIGLSVEANSTYVGTLYLGIGCNNTGGVKFAFTFPAGATLNIGATGYLSNNSAQRMEQTVALASGTLYPSSGTNFNAVNAQGGYVIIDFTLVTAGTSGTFQPQYASGTNTQVSTIYANTTKIRMEKIA